MTLQFAEYTGPQITTVFVPAVANKIIRVLAVLASSWANMRVTLHSDPGGAQNRDLTPTLYAGGGRAAELRMGRMYAVSTDRGKALGLSLDYQGSALPVGVAVWYEVIG
jgi:hypothetical protein